MVFHKFVIVVWLGVLLIMGLSAECFAFKIVMGWKHPHYTQPEGFRIYWKRVTEDWSPTRMVEVPNTMTAPDQEQEYELEVDAGVYWCIAVTAYDSAGNESLIGNSTTEDENASHLECMWVDTDDMAVQ